MLPINPSFPKNIERNNYKISVVADNKIELSVFPNPVNSDQQINVSLQKYDKAVDMKVYLFNGELIHNKTYEDSNFELSISDLF